MLEKQPVYLSREDLALLGFDPSRFICIRGGLEWHGYCPKCGGKDRFLISNGLFRCRQCQFSGNLHELGYLPKELLAQRAEEAQRREAELAECARRRLKRYVVSGMLDRWHSYLLWYKRDWLERKCGISLEVAKRHKIGYANRFRFFIDQQVVEREALVIPVWGEGGALKTVRLRLLNDPKFSYRPLVSYLGNHPLLAHPAWYRGCVVVTEGEKKALVLESQGIPAIGLPGAETWAIDYILSRLLEYAKIIVILDNDEAGKRNAQRLVSTLWAYGKEAVAFVPPTKIDDDLRSGCVTKTEILSLFNSSVLTKSISVL